ncbi:Hypothetical predicted protein [Olea europaea subsp. europaea]|uniref:J domain-containing protein n=1 Tax=Olea europaea subsp. europaea TaxID=158383 RepID=A0A8S0QBB7_OLEEU|nr:Hypothetical predicted protein [Olea europaea subsp. europaea]
MSCAVVSGTETYFHFLSKPTKKSITESFSSISFRSKLTNSRIQLKNPSGMTPRNHSRASFKAFYAPTQATDSNLYDVLGIEESGTISDIKKAYKQMARKYHPDVSPSDRVDENTRRFILVKEAYETLSDPNTRALYDHDLAHGLGFKQRSDSDWKMRWQSQLNELKHRQRNSGGRMSWGARMRSRR